MDPYLQKASHVVRTCNKKPLVLVFVVVGNDALHNAAAPSTTQPPSSLSLMCASASRFFLCVCRFLDAHILQAGANQPLPEYPPGLPQQFQLTPSWLNTPLGPVVPPFQCKLGAS